MVVLKNNILILILIFTSSCAFANKQIKIIVKNSLNNCIVVKQLMPIFRKDIPLIKINYEIKKPVSSCGYKSALLLYSTNVILDGYESSLITGKFILPKNTILKLPIATNKILIGN